MKLRLTTCISIFRYIIAIILLMIKILLNLKVNIVTKPFMVDDLQVPEEFNEIIEKARDSIKLLSERIDSKLYKHITVFVDPIDGTREFATGQGEHCSILIGYNDQQGKPVAGIIYR